MVPVWLAVIVTLLALVVGALGGFLLPRPIREIKVELAKKRFPGSLECTHSIPEAVIRIVFGSALILLALAGGIAVWLA